MTWYVAALRPGGRGAAMRNLEHQGFEVFNPKYELRRVRRGATTVVDVPLFPGYLLVAFDQAAQWHWRVVNSTLGVKGLLPLHSDNPLPLPLSAVQELVSWQASVELQALVGDWAPRRGEIVEIVSGPFFGFTGKVVGPVKDRIRVLTSLLGRETVVTLGMNQVARVAATPEQRKVASLR